MAKNYLFKFGKIALVVSCESLADAKALAANYGDSVKVSEYDGQDVEPVAGRDLRHVVPVKKNAESKN